MHRFNSVNDSGAEAQHAATLNHHAGKPNQRFAHPTE